MTEFILREGTLNDNTLLLADKGKVFRGGYIAIIKEYTFASSWHNNEHVKRFKTEKTLLAYLNKHYPDFEYMYDISETVLQEC